MISIPFVGVLRSEVLEKAGFNLERIKSADVEEIANLDGFSIEIAKRIKKYAELVDKNYKVPKETIFKEFRCPKCGAIVSEIESACHRCGYQFFKPSERYEEDMDSLAEVIIQIYKNPKDPSLWREGERILVSMDFENKASDFKFKASTLELELLEEEERREKEAEEEIKAPPKMISIADMYRKSLTNGLVNGMGVKRHEQRKMPWIQVLTILLILVVPVVFAAMMTTAASPPIIIDGNFSDWKNVEGLNIYSSFFTSFKVKFYDGTTYLYLSTAYPLFKNSSKAYLMIFIDSDSHSNTGFPINKIGADYMLAIYGSENLLKTQFASYNNNSWAFGGKFDYAVRKNMCEIRTLKLNNNARFILYYNDGIEHYSSVVSLKPVLSIEYSGGKVLRENDLVEKIILWNSYKGNVKISILTLKNIGNSTATIRLKYGSFEDTMNVSPGNNTVPLNESLTVNKASEMDIYYLGGGKKYGTLKFKIYTDVSEIEMDKSQGSYIGGIPFNKIIDGIFLDWTSPHLSKRANLPGDVDIREYQVSNENSVKMYINVYGMLMGLSPPKIALKGNATQGNSTQNKKLPIDSIEVFVDSDRNPISGYRIGGIGAEYRIIMSGNLGKIKEVKAYKWADGAWVSTNLNIKSAMDYNSIEMDLGVSGNVYFRLVNWLGLQDKLPFQEPLKSIHPHTKAKDNTTHSSYDKTSEKIVHPEFLGTYNLTELRALFGTDVQVTTSSYDESRPTITRTSDGTLWVTFHNSSSALCFANSTDGGATWTTYGTTAENNPSNPIIISDSSDNVYIFFENHTSGSNFSYYEYKNSDKAWHKYYISSWTGWDKVYNLSAATYTVSSSIYIYVFFDYANSSAEYNVGRAKTWDSGSHWDAANIASTTDWEGHPSTTISTGTNPEVFVAYDHYDGNYWNITVLNNTNINSTSWSGYVFYGSGHDLTYPSVYGTGDDIYLVGEGAYSSTDHDIWLINTTDNGATWKWGSWVANTSDDETYPSVLADGAHVYVFYLNATSGYICERNSSDYGQTWGNVSKVSDQGSGVAIYRTVSSYYYNGNLYVVWTDSRNGNDDIYFDKVPEFNPFSLVPLLIVAAIVIRKVRRCKANI